VVGEKPCILGDGKLCSNFLSNHRLLTDYETGKN